MAESFLDRIKRGLGLGGYASSRGGLTATFASRPRGTSLPLSKLQAHFRILHKASGRLPADAAIYVADGSNSSILGTLQGNAAQASWRNRTWSWPRRDEDALFSDLSAWQVDQMQRFGEVHAALEPINNDWGVFGTKKSPDWLRHVVTIWLGHDRKGQPVQTLVDLAELTGDPVGPVLDVLFCRDAALYGSDNSVGRFAGVKPWLEASHEAVCRVAPGLAADVRAELASALGRFGVQGQFCGLLLDLATGTAKKTRAQARQSLTACNPELLRTALAERHAAASPAQRAELVDVLAETLGAQGADLIAAWREGESNARVLAAMDRVAGVTGAQAAGSAPRSADQRPDGPEGYLAVDGTWVDAGPVPPAPGFEKVPTELLATLDPAVTAFNEFLVKARAEANANRWHWSRQFSTKDGRDLKRLAELAEGSNPIATHSKHPATDWLKWHQFNHPRVEAFFSDPRLTLRHLARLAVAMTNGHFQSLFGDWSGPAGAAVQRRLAAGADIRLFNALWVEAGGGDFVTQHLTARWYGPLPEFETPLWPLLCERFGQFDQALGLVPQSDAEQKRPGPGLRLLEQFPRLPERYRGRLILMAGDSDSRIRDRARALLHGAEGIDGAIALQLQDGKQDVRALAADWLAARGAKDQAGAIRTALAKEKSDLARAAMITALERLGEDVSAYFDPVVLAAEARAGLAKIKAKGLDWLPAAMLPALQWADGSPVDPVLPQWWLVLSAKLKQPGGNAMVNLWLDRLAPGHAHKLGWLVLTGWMDEDTRRPTDEEANAYAAQHVDATVRQNMDYAKRWPQSADYFSTDRAVVFSRLKQAKAGEYLGSAADSKGVLALAARVGGADAAQRIRPFLKDHGSRTSQAKALMEVLAAIGDGSALQLLLSAANRSKQRSVQAHAAALVEQIAERNGWSPAQLADRTIPTGGFDIDGTQDLELGEGRTYRLQFDESDAVIILNADGREVKALPGPRIDTEKPLVDAARKQLSNARKEVKQVLGAQVERLREAMYLQRGWDPAEWESFVIGHPIVGRLAARLVWRGIDGEGRALATFRPLGDGSHTDAADNDVDPTDFAAIRLAHSSLLSAEDNAAWRRHLADYAVTPPFDQFGRELPELPEVQKRERAIGDRKGWMIETFKLRGLAAKLGYQRGQAQDGGWFYSYEKTYREAGLVAEIEFTGSPLPEENRPAALQTLGFRRLRASGSGGGGQVTLGDVPPVLLAESWRDLHDIADKGTGFDPDWQKKAYV